MYICAFIYIHIYMYICYAVCCQMLMCVYECHAVCFPRKVRVCVVCSLYMNLCVYIYICFTWFMHIYTWMYIYVKSVPPLVTISKSFFQSSKLKLVRLFCNVWMKRDLWALASGFASGFGKCHCRWDRLLSNIYIRKWRHWCKLTQLRVHKEWVQEICMANESFKGKWDL